MTTTIHRILYDKNGQEDTELIMTEYSDNPKALLSDLIEKAKRTVLNIRMNS